MMSSWLLVVGLRSQLLNFWITKPLPWPADTSAAICRVAQRVLHVVHQGSQREGIQFEYTV